METNTDIFAVPCKVLAEDMGLRIHQRETFTKWDLPDATNLIVAVSFGLFVPPRILRSAKYGGLNVHPSLLPDLRGPAPIHHAILRGYQHTGVSLQTLDAKAFDHGTVLAQTPRPGISVPSDCTVQELTNLLAPIGAQMLQERSQTSSSPTPPKVTKADGHVDWAQWTGEEFVRRVRVLGSVWTHAFNKKGELKRLIIQDAEVVPLEEAAIYGGEVSFVQSPELGLESPKFAALLSDQCDGSCLIRVSNFDLVRVKRVKEEGKPERDAMVVLKSFK
ncbi:hypothetical protein NM208_g6941 [Fusarium decemcellulare]|uniref:Uncharacterized protein n=1 Tax=Fusarium decemcellulare TaxID=57161 RepID=A0ACC1SB96_9HYPO|nr:hypothetical protein NM208_g6941 [Fusarium decemcellulare]